ncbi:hypothetical protein BBP40_006165 [Aspergillus hancockii]|nr:hypothetical protein BBP40_006165 [Aspergillus hancockii]
MPSDPDVTALLKTGSENILAIEVAGGWYAGQIAWNEGSTCFYGDEIGAFAQHIANELNSLCIPTDVSCYGDIANAFTITWPTPGQLDFVFTNAGVVEHYSFYAHQSEDERGLPPPPSLGTVNVSLASILYTSYLALHFVRKQ